MIETKFDGMEEYYSEWEVTCDLCGEVLEIEAMDFLDLIKIMKDHQWISIETDNGWEHYCPSCY